MSPNSTTRVSKPIRNKQTTANTRPAKLFELEPETLQKTLNTKFRVLGQGLGFRGLGFRGLGIKPEA